MDPAPKSACPVVRLTGSYRRFDTIAIMHTKQLLFALAFTLLVVFTGSPVSVHT
jgi:hypothetical protein